MTFFKTYFTLFAVILLMFACQNSAKKTQEKTATDSITIDSNIALNTDTVTKKPEITKPIPTNPNGILITCNTVGKIKLHDTFEDIERKAGKNNIKFDSLFVNGVFANSYDTKLWKGTVGEITIKWQESQQPYKTIQSIIIEKPFANYVVQNGIKIGTTLSQVVKLNDGKAVSLLGFSGKNGGTLMSFNQGSITTMLPCMRLVFEIPKAKSYPKEVNAIMGTNLVQSSLVAFKIYDVKVAKIIINSDR